jgi:hypothetical protein
MPPGAMSVISSAYALQALTANSAAAAGAKSCFMVTPPLLIFYLLQCCRARPIGPPRC